MDSMWELDAKVPSCRYRWHSSCQCCHFSSISVSVWVLPSWTEVRYIKKTPSQITTGTWAELIVIRAKKLNTGLPSNFSLPYNCIWSVFTQLNKAKDLKSVPWKITMMQLQFFLHKEITAAEGNFAGKVFSKYSVQENSSQQELFQTTR